MLHRSALGGLALVAVILASTPSASTTLRGTSLQDLSISAETIVRGACLEARVETIAMGGAEIAVTVYTFQAVDRIKGDPGAQFSFRQVGTPERGLLDLGRLAGLPVYRPGNEYVLFLLPESRHGLTSPSGAGEGAFAVSGFHVVPLRGSPRLAEDLREKVDPGPGAVMTYEALREAVLAELGR